MKPQHSGPRGFRLRRRDEEIHQQGLSTASTVLYVRNDFVWWLECFRYSDSEDQAKDEPHGIPPWAPESTPFSLTKRYVHCALMTE